jgi:hypothetical protein
MIDNERAAQWANDAGVALTRFYGKNDATAHLAVIVLALLKDREERERFCSRIAPATDALELVACD